MLAKDGSTIICLEIRQKNCFGSNFVTVHQAVNSCFRIIYHESVVLQFAAWPIHPLRCPVTYAVTELPMSRTTSCRSSKKRPQDPCSRSQHGIAHHCFMQFQRTRQNPLALISNVMESKAVPSSGIPATFPVISHKLW